MTEATRDPLHPPARQAGNDLTCGRRGGAVRDDESTAVAVAANAIRQARQGKPGDPWEWDACTQDDVDRARCLVDAIASVAQRS